MDYSSVVAFVMAEGLPQLNLDDAMLTPDERMLPRAARPPILQPNGIQ